MVKIRAEIFFSFSFFFFFAYQEDEVDGLCLPVRTRLDVVHVPHDYAVNNGVHYEHGPHQAHGKLIVTANRLSQVVELCPSGRLLL